MKYLEHSPYLRYVDESIFKHAIDLDILGVNEYAWPSDLVIQLIKLTAKNNLLILGGDVLVMKKGIPSYTGDSWTYQENDVVEGENKSLDYIKRYIDINGPDFLFAIVVKK
ncbi:MAG: Imm40 family immunity protein [Bacteroidia bacterium]|jgi:hypothetical protein